MWTIRALLSNKSIPTFKTANVIGPGTTARGDLSGPGGFRVDGTVEGNVETDGPVVIGENGAIDGTVKARDVIVLGRVRGDLSADGHLEIGPKGKVVGDITVKSLKMHEGGVFRGTSRMSGAEDLVTTTNPFGMLPVAVESALAEEAPRGGRTLPPPVGAVVPPPPESAPVASEERLIAPPPLPVATKDAANG